MTDESPNPDEAHASRAPGVLAPGCLAGRVALVTGGGTGIGRAIALMTSALGAEVVVMGRRADLLEETVSLATGPAMTAIPVDLREFDAVDAALDRALERHGHIDLLVNNAGGQFLAPAEDVSPNGFRAVTRLNLDAPWYLTTRVAARSMIPRGYGKVVSITMSPLRGIPGMAHSSAARAGVGGLMEVLAAEWARYGIRLVAVAPGIVHTESWEDRYGLDPGETGKSLPLGRLQTPDEVAALVAFLLSTAGDYITGTTILADGGFTFVSSTPPQLG